MIAALLRPFALALPLLITGIGSGTSALAQSLRGVIQPAELQARLSDPSIVIIDIRSGDTRPAGAALFKAGHIPGAVHADYGFASWRLPRDNTSVYLPEPGQFEALAGDLGVSNDSHVVLVHDGNDATSFGAAARVYWTFKAMGHASVAILDGGYRNWNAAKLAISTEAKAPQASIYEAKPDPSVRASLDDVLAAQSKGVTLVDGRPESFFSGLEKHRAITAFGHIPGAINIPHAKAINASFTLKDKAALAKDYSTAGTAAIVSYCNTGHWAATNWFVLSEILDHKNVKLYDGSMLEYAAEKRGPVLNPRMRSGS